MHTPNEEAERQAWNEKMDKRREKFEGVFYAHGVIKSGMHLPTSGLVMRANDFAPQSPDYRLPNDVHAHPTIQMAEKHFVRWRNAASATPAQLRELNRLQNDMRDTLREMPSIRFSAGPEASRAIDRLGQEYMCDMANIFLSQPERGVDVIDTVYDRGMNALASHILTRTVAKEIKSKTPQVGEGEFLCDVGDKTTLFVSDGLIGIVPPPDADGNSIALDVDMDQGLLRFSFNKGDTLGDHDFKVRIDRINREMAHELFEAVKRCTNVLSA